jgi:hypothetical protein
MKRLNLWDFDDTLAASDEAVERLSAEHPEVAYADWWRDPRVSTVAALETRPFPSMWRTLARTPGRHVLFSGRVPEAVEAWLDKYRDDPDIGSGIEVLEGAIPVPHFRKAGERIPEVKLRLIRDLVRDGEDDIHLYDDHADLPAMVAAAGIPHLTLHPAAHGYLLNGKRRTCGCDAHRNSRA